VPTTVVAPQLSIDLHAAASSYTGQGVSVRGYLHYLARHDVAIRLLDLSPGGGREGFVRRFAGLAATPLDPTRPGAWIHVGGGGEFSPGTAHHRDQAQAAGRAAAYHLWWELPVLRPEVVAELERFDAVVVSTRFIEDVARRHLRSPAVLYAPQPLAVADLPRPAPDRGRFGIPPAAVAVLLGFEPSSDLERKNPRAALEAFARAAAHAPQLRLVIKLMLPPAGADGLAPRLAWLRAAAAADPRIIVVDDALGDDDLYTLFASCDAYLSLHRAEGLGLGMLEAMHLGLPVVATAYSGNISFMDERSACLVPFRTVPVQGTSVPTYAAVAALGPTWADPDVDAAAAHLVRLANDAGWRAGRGRAAASAAAAYQREALRFEWLAALAAIARERQARALAARRVYTGVSATFRLG
jgi:glycosyltransferase involved in cell wall biosynthesis